MGKLIRVTAGLLAGALFGAAIVLLFAPQSGAETQQLIRDRVEGIMAEGQQAAEQRRLELTQRFESLKQPGPQA
jgi:gas vesicle protein